MYLDLKIIQKKTGLKLFRKFYVLSIQIVNKLLINEIDEILTTLVRLD